MATARDIIQFYFQDNPFTRVYLSLHEILPLHLSVKVLKFLGPPLHYLYVS